MTNSSLAFLSGGGEQGARLRAGDTPLGDPTHWPTPLLTLVAVMLASNQPMFVAWGPERTLLYNDAYAPILGNKHPQALGRPFLDVWQEIRADLEPIVASAFAGVPVQMDDIPLLMDRHGYLEETHFSFFYSPVRGQSGEVNGLFCACNEITQQVMAERQLAAREARYRNVLANMDEGFALMDADFRFLEFNSVALRMLGQSASQAVGRAHWDAFPDSFDSDQGRMYRAVAADGKARSLEQDFAFPDGSVRRCEVRALAVEDGVAVFFRDVTQRWITSQEAALAAERVQLALDAGAIVGTWVWTIGDNRFIADERFAASFDLDPVQCRSGLPLEAALDAIHPDHLPRVQAAIGEAMERGGPYRCEYRVRQHGQGWHWVEANGHVELDADGTPVRFPGVLLDVEERRRTELERDRATTLLEAFSEAVPGVVYAKDRGGRFMVINRGVSDLLGIPASQCLGRTDRDLLADTAQADAVMATDRRVMESGVIEQIEEQVQHADGTPATWLSTKAPFRDADGEVIGLIGSSVDITERKRAEDALRLSEQRSALAMEIAQIGTWSWDVADGTMAADARCREMCGLPARTQRLAFDAVVERVHPDDRERVHAAFAQALDPHGDGRYAEEFRWLHQDGTVVWTFSRAQALFEGNGAARAPVLLLGSVIDVTERRRMIETLREADRRKDEFLAMLAHELRNPLAPIGTAAQLLAITSEQPERVRHASRVIARQVGHMKALVDDLLDVSRVTRGLVEIEREPVDLRSAIAAAVEQVEPLMRAHGHVLATETGARPAVVMGDRHRLVQVIANILNNAAKYTPPAGRVTVALDAVDGKAVVLVSDTGIGMGEDLLPRVFDLFTQAERTPDRTQGGLGIGLALVRSLVQLHGGSVTAASVGPNQGSTFTVTLPLAQSDAEAASMTSLPVSSARPRRVLVVDDNRDAVDTLASVLTLSGHSVGVANDGREALALAADSDFDVCVLDIGLPDMTGFELATALRAMPGGAGRLLIALTGYGHAHDKAMSRAAGFDHHLVKPADVDHLLATIAKA